MTDRRLSRLSASLLVAAVAMAACGDDTETDDGGDGSTVTGAAHSDDTTGNSEEAASGSTVTEASESLDGGSDIQYGGEVVFALEGNVSTLDPAQALVNTADVNVALAVYDPLVSFDEDGNHEPYLAEDVVANETFEEWTITLPEGVMFHDGTELDAGAVVSHWDRVADPAHSSPHQSYVSSWDVATPDSRTVVVTLDEPNSAFPNRLALAPGFIPSPTAVEKAGEEFSRQPVGTGPFRMTSFTSGEMIVERNDDYWQSDRNGEQLPRLDRVVFRPIPDTRARLAALQAGDVDMLQTAGTETAVEADNSGELDVHWVNPSSSTILLINHRVPPFERLEARQAIEYAIDRDRINDLVYDGTRTPSYSPFRPEHDFYANVGQRQHDLAEAQRLVDEVGGISLTLACVDTPEGRSFLELIAQQLEAAGMDVSLDFQELGAYIARVYGTSDFEVACFQNSQLADPDELHDSFYTDASSNLSGYSNPDMDAALDAGRQSGDPRDRYSAYEEVQRIFHEDVPYVTLMYDTFANVAAPHVQGVPAAEPIAVGSIKVAYLWRDE